MRVEAARVGADLKTHKEVFRTALSILSILNYACLVVIILARRTTRTDNVRQLVIKACTNKGARAEIVAVFRHSYAVSVRVLLLIILIFTSISWTSKFPFPMCFLIAWSPALFPAWVLLQLATFIRLMAALSSQEVEAYYSELEAAGSECIEAQDFVLRVSSGFWLQMLRKHQTLVSSLTGMSRAISGTVLLFQNVVACPSLLMLWVARASKGCPTSASVYILLAFILACAGIMAMLPLAAITDLCRSKKAGARSIVTLADKYSGWPMSLDEHAEYMRFVQHIHTVEAGIYIPTMGLVTRSSLIGKISFYLKALPLTLVFTLRWWQST